MEFNPPPRKEDMNEEREKLKKELHQLFVQNKCIWCHSSLDTCVDYILQDRRRICEPIIEARYMLNKLLKPNPLEKEIEKLLTEALVKAGLEQEK